jgi:hypothetical protein
MFAPLALFLTACDANGLPSTDAEMWGIVAISGIIAATICFCVWAVTR